MKVLHVFKTYLPNSFNGIERVIWEIAEGAADQGVESEVFFLSDHATPRTPVARHWARSSRQDLVLASTSFSLSAFGAFGRLVREADLVHYHFPWPMMDLLDLATSHHKPRVVTYHSDIVKQRRLRHLYAPLMRAFLNRADAIVATSPNYLASSPVLQRYPEKVSVIPIGLDPRRQVKADAAVVEQWRRRLPERFFLFVGMLRYYKGLGFLIEAARRTGLPLVIAGGGELEPALAENLPAGVTLLGMIDDTAKSAILELADGFIFPSHLRSEAFGVALLEAAFAGKPMVSCEIGTGTSYVNLHGVTGLVVPPADSGALADAMSTLFNDPDLRARFGAAARQRAHDLFSSEVMAGAYVRLYRDLLGSKQRHAAE